jgi:hypothetical protein
VLKAAEPNAGGGGERNCEVLFRKYGLTPPRLAPPGAPFAIQKPGPTGTVPVQGSEKPSLIRCATISLPTARPTAKPRVNCGCTSPGPDWASDATCCSNDAAADG